MNFSSKVGSKYIIVAAMQPVRVVRNKEGSAVEIFEKDEMQALLWANLTLNGGIMMPQVILKVFENKELKNLILLKSVYMSKKDYADYGLKKDTPKDVRIEKFKEYVKLHKEKYREQMVSIFNEAKRELEALKKHSAPEGETALTPHAAQQLKDFIFSPNQQHVEDLLLDMKDKGYIRPMTKGQYKGLLLTDMKAINRVVLNPKLRNTPSGISALIAKDLADKLVKWTRWGFSVHLLDQIRWWAENMAKQFNFPEDETKKFVNEANKAAEFYSKELYNIVLAFNKKIMKPT